MLKHDVIMELDEREFERNPDKKFIYRRGKPCDYFVLILEVRSSYRLLFFFFCLARVTHATTNSGGDGTSKTTERKTKYRRLAESALAP